MRVRKVKTKALSDLMLPNEKSELYRDGIIINYESIYMILPMAVTAMTMTDGIIVRSPQDQQQQHL